VILADARAVERCVSAGVGADLTLEVGGRGEPRWCAPVRLSGRVRRLGDGRFEEPTATHGGRRLFDAGPSAVVDVDGGTILILTSRAEMPTSLEQLRALDIEPERVPILTAKGVISPRAGYERVARATWVADTPGVTAAGLSGFSYQRRRRPLHPFERDVSFEAASSGTPPGTRPGAPR
jgi:microcystin degradation protein MlrC